MFKRLAVGLALGVWAITSVAQGATLTVDGIGGTFKSATTTNPKKGALTGLGTNTIAWGTPWTAADTRSSYSFGGTTTAVSTTSSFLIGSYTHKNGTIATSSDRLRSTTLDVSVSGLAGTIAYAIMSSFYLTHNETQNNTKLCPAGQSPCGDLVTITNTAKGSITIQDGLDTYALIIDGFVDQLGGPVISNFLTAENKSRTLYLQASLTVTSLPPPPPVPLPAAGVALATGLGAFAAIRRRKRG